MIRKLSPPEIVAAIRGLDAEELTTLVELLGGDSGDGVTPRRQDDSWALLAAAGLEKAYGATEPEYSEKDLVP